MEEHLGLDQWELVQDNIRIAEGRESQAMQAAAQEEVAGEIADRQLVDDEEEALEEGL